jgi:hypothetical protein
MRRLTILTLVAALALAACSSSSKKKTASESTTSTAPSTRVTGKAYSPEEGSTQGVNGTGIVVDVAFRSKEADLLKATVRSTSAGKPGRNTNFPGLVVTLSTTAASLGGPQANLADLFQIVGLSQQSDGSTEAWATWVNGKALFGLDVDSTLEAYVVSGEAPATAPTDRTGLDVVSNIVTVKFRVSAAAPGTSTSSTAAGGVTSTTSSGGRTTTTIRTTTTHATTPTTAHSATTTPVTTAP